MPCGSQVGGHSRRRAAAGTANSLKLKASLSGIIKLDPKQHALAAAQGRRSHTVTRSAPASFQHQGPQHRLVYHVSNAPRVQRRRTPPSLGLAAIIALPLHVITIVHVIQVPCRCAAPGPLLLLLLLPRVRRAADQANVRSVSLNPHQLEGAPVCPRHRGREA